MTDLVKNIIGVDPLEVIERDENYSGIYPDELETIVERELNIRNQPRDVFGAIKMR